MRARMSVDRRMLPIAGWMIFVVGLGGCASTGAPDGWLPTAKEAGSDPYGAWITVRSADDAVPPVGGEFIAVEADDVLVMTSAGLRAVRRDGITEAKVAHFDPQNHNASGWVALGVLSTISHGWGLVISAPLWALLGGTSAGAHSRTPLVEYPDHSWHDLGRYARFPQGLPASVDPATLTAKDFPATTVAPDGF